MRISTSFKEPGQIEKINAEKAWEDLFKMLIQELPSKNIYDFSSTYQSFNSSLCPEWVLMI